MVEGGHFFVCVLEGEKAAMTTPFILYFRKQNDQQSLNWNFSFSLLFLNFLVAP